MGSSLKRKFMLGSFANGSSALRPVEDQRRLGLLQLGGDLLHLPHGAEVVAPGDLEHVLVGIAAPEQLGEQERVRA